MKNRRPVCKNVEKAEWVACPGVQNGRLRRGCTATPSESTENLCTSCHAKMADGLNTPEVQGKVHCVKSCRKVLFPVQFISAFRHSLDQLNWLETMMDLDLSAARLLKLKKPENN